MSDNKVVNKGQGGARIAIPKPEQRRTMRAVTQAIRKMHPATMRMTFLVEDFNTEGKLVQLFKQGKTLYIITHYYTNNQGTVVFTHAEVKATAGPQVIYKAVRVEYDSVEETPAFMLDSNGVPEEVTLESFTDDFIEKALKAKIQSKISYDGYTIYNSRLFVPTDGMFETLDEFKKKVHQ